MHGSRTAFSQALGRGRVGGAGGWRGRWALPVCCFTSISFLFPDNIASFFLRNSSCTASTLDAVSVVFSMTKGQTCQPSKAKRNLLPGNVSLEVPDMWKLVKPIHVDSGGTALWFLHLYPPVCSGLCLFSFPDYQLCLILPLDSRKEVSGKQEPLSYSFLKPELTNPSV